MEGPCVFAAARKRASCSSRRKATSFTSGLSRRQCYRETGRFVILSGATASRSGAVAELKDPYQSNSPTRVREFSHARANEFSATVHQPLGIRTGMTGDLG